MTCLTCSRRICASSSSASIRGACPLPPARTSPTRATTSGGSCMPPGYVASLRADEQFALLDEGIGVTNAAFRTTPGSGDLRRADFARSAERLEKIARELRPQWLAFVGKEAYRGAFGSGRRSACRKRGSATRGSSSYRRPRRRTRPCRGGNGCDGSTTSPAAHPGYRSAKRCAPRWSRRMGAR